MSPACSHTTGLTRWWANSFQGTIWTSSVSHDSFLKPREMQNLNQNYDVEGFERETG